MWYQLYNGNVHLVPERNMDNPSEWPIADLPLSDISSEDLEVLVLMIQEQVANMYNGKQEGKVLNQQILSSMQRTFVVFLNSLMKL